MIVENYLSSYFPSIHYSRYRTTTNESTITVYNSDKNVSRETFLSTASRNQTSTDLVL